MAELIESADVGAGVIVVAEEALADGAADELDALLARQPAWSDLPVILLLSTGATLVSSRALLARFAVRGNVTLLERPVRTIALVSTLQAALRARRRQYEVQAHLAGRMQAQAALERSEARYRSLTDASASIVWTTDVAGAFVTDVASWAEYTGQTRGEYAGWGWLDAVHPDDREGVVAAWTRSREAGDTYYAEYRLRRRDREYRRVVSRGVLVPSPDGEPLEWVGTCTDVEDERRAADHLRQTQRIEAVGSLAGGVAHEVNNMMTVVIGFGKFVLDGMSRDDPFRQDVGEMVKAATRAAGITRQLLAFSRQQILQPVVLEVNAVVKESARMLEGLLGADIELALELDARDTRVRADLTQLEQVIVNLALNARDAMPSGGRLTLGSAVVQVDHHYAVRHGGVRIENGSYVMLSVTDTGAGMNAATRARAFEPFYTTKPVGRGTGLGLSTVYGIVKQSGGYIWLYSEPGHGTAVKVYLPEAVGAPDGRGAPEPAPRGRHETLVVVEDEDAVRALARRSLEEAGYVVYEAAHAGEALDLIEGCSVAVDLVVCDLVMPGMSGHEFGRRLRQVRPDLPVLYMSGYPGSQVEARGLLDPGVPFLEKPFTSEQLATQVRRLLDSRVRPSD